MLGAQALRTKQKVEQKEKEKKHRDRLRNLEIQRERIEKAARDGEAKFLEKMAHLRMEDEKALHEIVKETKHNKQDWNHSIQASLSRHLEPIHESNNPRKSLSVPRKSASAEFVKKSVKHKRRSVDYVGGESTGRNRILKWLGFTSSEPANDQQSPKKSPKRRMSTFT